MSMFDRHVAQETHPPDRRGKRIPWAVLASVAIHGAGAFGLYAFALVPLKEAALAPRAPTLTSVGIAGRPTPQAAISSQGDQPQPAGMKFPTRKPKAPMPVPQLLGMKENKDTSSELEGAPDVDQEAIKEGTKEVSKERSTQGTHQATGQGSKEGDIAAKTVSPVATTPPSSKPQNMPHTPDLGEFVSRLEPHVPDWVKAQRQGTGDADYLAVLCVDRGGHVTDIKLKQGVPGADDEIQRVLQTWQLKPQPIPICFPLKLTFAFE